MFYHGGISYLARPTVLTSCPHQLRLFSSGWTSQFALNPFLWLFPAGGKGWPVSGHGARGCKLILVQVLGYPGCSPFFLLSTRSLGD